MIRLIDEHVGRRLKERRVTVCITKLEMADILNVPKSLLEKYEAGGVSIPAGDLFKAAKALEVRIGYFYEGLNQRFSTITNVESKPPKRRVMARPFSILVGRPTPRNT